MKTAYATTILENGLRVVTHVMPGRKSVALGIWIRVGGRYEETANKGISHFLEHLLFKGTRNYSCRQIKESIEGVGGSLNGFTAEEMTCYLVKLPAQYLARAFRVLSDMVRAPSLPAAEVDRERGVILEEMKMYRDLPQSHVHELLDALLWPDHPMGESIIGTEASLLRTDRQALRSFQQRFYVPANMVIAAAGAFEPARLLCLARAAFGRLPPGGRSSFMRVGEPGTGPQFFLNAKATEQSHLALGYHAFRRDHPLRHAAGLLHIILGANMSSRLFNEVREKRGLAYEIGSQLKRFNDTGVFLVHAGIDNAKVYDALGLIVEELEKTTRRAVSAAELRRAKDFYGGQLSLGLEDTLEHMLWLGEPMVTQERTYSLEDIIRQVRAVCAADIRAAARQIFQRRCLNVALIGPLQDQERRLRALLGCPGA